MDSSFTLVEEQRGSGRARLSCIGRDIEYRELELRRNADNVWEVNADSCHQPELLGGKVVVLLSALLQNRLQFIGTPTELTQLIDPDGTEGITPKNISRKILQGAEALHTAGIRAAVRRSNGKLLIDLRRADTPTRLPIRTESDDPDDGGSYQPSAFQAGGGDGYDDECAGGRDGDQ